MAKFPDKIELDEQVYDELFKTVEWYENCPIHLFEERLIPQSFHDDLYEYMSSKVIHDDQDGEIFLSVIGVKDGKLVALVALIDTSDGQIEDVVVSIVPKKQID